MPELDPSVELVNDNTPQISRMQIDLLVNALANDMTRVATLQYMRSVGQAQMRWLGIQEGHHSLSHEPDDNKDSLRQAAQDQHLVLRRTRLSRQAPRRNARARRRRQHARPHPHRLDQRTRQRQHPHPRQHPLCHGRRRRRLQDGPQPASSTKSPHNRLWLALAHAMGHQISRPSAKPTSAKAARST